MSDQSTDPGPAAERPPTNDARAEKIVGASSTAASEQNSDEPIATSDATSSGQQGDSKNGADQTGNRLHASTVWLPGLEALVGFLVPMVVAIFFVPVGFLAIAAAWYTVASVVFHIYRYWTFRYRVTQGELILNSGVVHRRERRIPFDRVQETLIYQGVIHRLMRVARLEVKTAGSDVKEASLNVIPRATAEQIKATIDGIPETTHEEYADDRRCDFLCKLSARELILGGLTSNLVATIAAVIATIVYFRWFVRFGSRWMGKVGEEVTDKIDKPIEAELPFQEWFDFASRTPDLGPLNAAVDFYLTETLAKSLVLAGMGLLGSVVAYLIRYYDFRLTRHGGTLETSYGLLTRHRGSLHRDRIQTLKLEEGLLRRQFGLASLRVDSAGDHHEVDEAKKRDVLVPVARKAEAEEVAMQAIPGLTDLDVDWRPISRLAVMRGSKKGWLLVAIAALQTYAMAGWYCLGLLPALPMVYFLNQRWYRNTGYWLGAEHFLSRKGWLNRSTICLPVKNIQNVTVTQSYFDRRLDLAVLSIDTAGQSNTGGGPVIRHLPVAVARHLQRTLTRSVVQ